MNPFMNAPMNAPMNDRSGMNCEEFETIGLDSRRDSISDECRQRAEQHARVCAKCWALRVSWKAAQTELDAFAESNEELMPPARVETRLLQQFRLKHQAQRERRTLKFATWALAAAAVLVCTVSVWNWQKWRQGPTGGSTGNVRAAAGSSIAEVLKPATSTQSTSQAGSSAEVLLASNDTGDFTQLPGSSSLEMEDAAIVRVGMQRASLAAFGLPVNEERASDWIQVDVLVGSDGSPQAVRLPE